MFCHELYLCIGSTYRVNTGIQELILENDLETIANQVVLASVN